MMAGDEYHTERERQQRLLDTERERAERPRWREWSHEERVRSQARAAYLFLNIVACPDCGLPWAAGHVHDVCPGPAPIRRHKGGVIGENAAGPPGSIRACS